MCSYAYDEGETDEITLRLNMDSVNETLQLQFQEKLGKAGLRVEETRLTHLANSPEIAQVMLRRQQAEAIVDARVKIVQGVVGIYHSQDHAKVIRFRYRSSIVLGYPNRISTVPVIRLGICDSLVSTMIE